MSFEKFDELEISNSIKDAISDMGFKKTTPIQKMTIPEALKGRDIIAQAQTGTGKTIAFAIPILEKIFIPDKSPQAVILCPTRELSIQVAGEIAKVGNNIGKLKILPVYGGQSIGKQTRVLKKGVHIVVGTPGRIIDHINRGNLDLIGVESIVLDEADEMLDMGFREDIEMILNNTPHQRQTLLFSATISDEIKKIAEQYQKKPKFIKTPSNKQNVPKIKQFYFKTNKKYKFDDLCKLIDVYDVKLVLIFCNTKKRVDFVVSHLKDRNYSVDGIHGDLIQKIRDKVMNKFRNGNINILVATDVVARGIDVDNIDIVINYDVPYTFDDYIHRIGRTARAGNTGCAFTLVIPQEYSLFGNIQNSNNIKIIQRKVPSFSEVESIKNKLIMDKLFLSVKNDDLKEYIKVVEKYSNDTSFKMMAAGLLKMVREN